MKTGTYPICEKCSRPITHHLHGVIVRGWVTQPTLPAESAKVLVCSPSNEIVAYCKSCFLTAIGCDNE